MTKELIEEMYVLAFNRSISKNLARLRHPLGEDVAQHETLRVIENLEIIRDSYPDPNTYAYVRARHAAIDGARREAVQRGEGSRLIRHPDGSISRARLVLSGDRQDPETGRTIFDSISSDEDSIAMAVRSSKLYQLVVDSLATKDPLAKEVLYLVKADGISIGDAARRLKISRQEASELLNSTLASIYTSAEGDDLAALQ